MKNEILKKMRTMILLLGVTLFFSSFVSSDDDYIIINCPGNLAYDPVVDACVPEAENDGTDSWGHELSCPNATIVIPN